MGSPLSQKTFFKADRSTIKWNTIGTHVLVLTQTDVDQANKSYYGETGGLYLLSASGTFDCRVTLDKEGPVHDFAWSPNAKEFGVIYGCKLHVFWHLLFANIWLRHARENHAVRPTGKNLT